MGTRFGGRAMSVPPQANSPCDAGPASVAFGRDEIAEHRGRWSQRSPLPASRAVPRSALSDPEREQYELQLDAYAVLLAEYEVQLAAANHDGLTGVWLRHAGQQLLEKEVQRAGRLDTPLSIAFVDVDGLKTLNDNHGHAAGDHALLTISRALAVGLRGYDHVVRWGGDEFLCVLPGVREGETVRRMQQVRSSLAAGERGLKISVGTAERRTGENADALVARADRELYLSRGQRPKG